MFLTQQSQIIKVYRQASRRDCGLIPRPSQEFLEDYVWLRDTLGAMGLRTSAKSAARLLALVGGVDQMESSQLEPLIDELIRRIADELESSLVLVFPEDRVSYFDAPTKICPANTFEAFPSSEYEMGEACKCFAVGRYTAAVFHAMRALEPGLKALGGNLGLSVETNWNTALNEIEAEIRRRNKANQGPSWKDDEPFNAEAATHFRFIKNAWRNHTAHLKERYDEERAEGILRHVGEFLRDIAKRLHE